MAGEQELICKRDGVATRLRCASCDVPICPACFVRTEVGLRCPDCGRARPGSRRKARRRHAPLVAALGAAVLVAGVVAGLARQDSADSPVARPTPTQVLEFEEVPPAPLPPPARPPQGVLRVIDRPDLGISFAIPTEMEVQPNDLGGAAFFAIERPGARGMLGWLRIFVLPPGEGVARTAERVTGELLAGRQGVRDLVSNPTQVATRPAWYVRFKLPLNADGTGPSFDQTYYFVQLDRGVFAIASASLEGQPPAAQLAVSTLRLH